MNYFRGLRSAHQIPSLLFLQFFTLNHTTQNNLLQHHGRQKHLPKALKDLITADEQQDGEAELSRPEIRGCLMFNIEMFKNAVLSLKVSFFYNTLLLSPRKNALFSCNLLLTGRIQLGQTLVFFVEELVGERELHLKFW